MPDKAFYLVFFTVAVIVAWILSRLFMKWYWLPRSYKNAEIAALAQRKQAAGGQVRVRQTDIEENLSKAQWERRRMAEDLIAKGEFVQGAAILEEIKFQRRAIDVLEQNGFLQEAADVLVRLGVPNRAAVLLERNGAFKAAAEYFTAAGLNDKAGECWLKLTDSGYDAFLSAAECFELAQEYDRMLDCYAAILRTDRVVSYCLSQGKYDFLVSYMSDPINAMSVFKLLNDDQLSEVVDRFGLNPKSSQILVNWINLLGTDEIAIPVLKKVARDQRIVDHFWKSLTPKVIPKTIETLVQSKKAFGAEALTMHADSLRRTNHAKYATEIYRQTHNYAGIANILIDNNQLPMLAQWLLKNGHAKIAESIQQLLGDKTQPPWDREVILRSRELAAALPGAKSARPEKVEGEVPKDPPSFEMKEEEKEVTPKDVTKIAS